MCGGGVSSQVYVTCKFVHVNAAKHVTLREQLTWLAILVVLLSSSYRHAYTHGSYSCIPAPYQ